jgi:hypothetical protein
MAKPAPARLHAKVAIGRARTGPNRIGHPTADGDRPCDRWTLNRVDSTA